MIEVKKIAIFWDIATSFIIYIYFQILLIRIDKRITNKI